MIISVSSHSISLTQDVEEFVHYAASAALRRFKYNVDSVDVHLKDVNGPKGGVDKTSTFRVHLRGGGQLVVEASGESLHAAVHRGAKRARRVVRRHLKKSIRFDRQRLSDTLPRGGALSISSA